MRRKQLLPNLTLFIHILDLLHCSTDPSFSLPALSPKRLHRKRSLKSNQNSLHIGTATAPWILELKRSWHESKWKWFLTAAVVRVVKKKMPATSDSQTSRQHVYDMKVFFSNPVRSSTAIPLFLLSTEKCSWEKQNQRNPSLTDRLQQQLKAKLI